MTTKYTNNAFYAVTGLLIMIFLAPVQAQQSAPEEILVTGSRIPQQNTNLLSASPVTQVSADEFLYTGVTRVEDLINDLPQVTGSNSSADANGATGTASIDLRDLGEERTLTLVNGRRLPTGTPLQGGAGGDLNFIPSILVERVEVMTGGASATYGSDAIAGVVNFIMKDDLDGFLFDLQGSAYQHNNDDSRAQDLLAESGFASPSGGTTDGEAYTLSAAWGTNFTGDRGNFTVYANYRDVEAVQQSQRDFSACAYGGLAIDDSLGCIGSGTIPDGRFINLKDGSQYIPVGDQFVPYDGRTFNFAPTNYFQRPDERISAGLMTHYDFSDTLTGYAEVGYMNNKTLAQIAPSGSFFNQIGINCDNPLMSAQQRQLMCGQFGLSGSDTVQTLVVKRNVEGGARADNIEHEQTRFVFGLRGDINDNWGFDVSANFGKVTIDQTYLNDLSITNIGRSQIVVTDPATGSPVCQSALSGADPSCVPWNLFTQGAVTDEAINYLTLPLTATGDTKMTDIIGYVTGDMSDYGWTVPGASNGVQVVLGLEYRKEELNYNPDANYQSGDGAGQGGPTVGVNGSFTAKELFAEAQVPLSDRMNLGLGYRHSDYDTDQKTDAFKVTFDWQFIDSLKTRASFQRASRHANVRELFRPQGIGLFEGEDPCDGTPSASLAQCGNSGVTAAQFGSILENPAGQYNELQGGNSLLTPEESDTYSVGFIWTPESISGLNVSVDWFSIDVSGAIDVAGAQFLLDECVFSNQFCDTINRGALGTLWLGQDQIVNTNANIGFQEREGFDVAANYQFDVGEGSMQLNYNAAIVTGNDRQPVPMSEVVDCNGKFSGRCEEPNPEYRHNLRLVWGTPWQDITTTVAWRHHGNVEEDSTNDVVEKFGSQNYFDLAALWPVNDGLTVRLGVNNLFDTQPPVTGTGSQRNNGNVEVSEYDVLGRYWFLGATYEFGQ